MVAWLSSIRQKYLCMCGDKLVLTGDMSQLSITKVDLSSMNTLEGTLGSRSVVRDAPTPHPLNLPGNLLHLSSLGNIDQLPKSITDLNLSLTNLGGR